MFDHDDTTITPRPARRRHGMTWTAVGILVGAALLGIGAGVLRVAAAGPQPTPTPSVSYKGTWRIIRVPGVQTGIHVPDPQSTATPVTKVVTKTVPVPGPTVTVPVPGPTVTVPGPAITVMCTVTVPAPVAGATPTAASTPVCTTSSPTP